VGNMLVDREASIDLLEKWVKNVGLRKHMLAVEAAVRHYARIYGEDEDLWGTAALLHDLDWEKYPDEHPQVGLTELERLGYPNEVLQAIRAELSGLVYACSLVRPNGIDDLKVKSVVKKFKDKAFAAGVDRGQVSRGIELLDIDRTEHVGNVIEALRGISDILEIRASDRV
jgi:putative nucleotidyltransferase with HDIG domain